MPNAGNGHILSGYEAYDTNGNKLKGTIAKITPSSDYYTTGTVGYGPIGPGYLDKTWRIIDGDFSYSSSTAANAAVVTVSKAGWFEKDTIVCKIDSDGETLVINV